MRRELYKKSVVFLCINSLVFLIIVTRKSQLTGQPARTVASGVGLCVGITMGKTWIGDERAISTRARLAFPMSPSQNPADRRRSRTPNSPRPPTSTPSNSHRRTNQTHSAGKARFPLPCAPRRPNHSPRPFHCTVAADDSSHAPP